MMVSTEFDVTRRKVFVFRFEKDLEFEAMFGLSSIRNGKSLERSTGEVLGQVRFDALKLPAGASRWNANGSPGALSEKVGRCFCGGTSSRLGAAI